MIAQSTTRSPEKTALEALAKTVVDMADMHSFLYDIQKHDKLPEGELMWHWQQVQTIHSICTYRMSAFTPEQREKLNKAFQQIGLQEL